MDKRGGSGPGYLHAPYSTALTTYPFIQGASGSADGFVTAPSFSYGSISVASNVIDRTAQTMVSYVNTTPGGSTSTAAVTSLANSQPLRIGSGSTGSPFQDFELLGVAIFRRALSADEIASIANYYGAS